MNIMERLQTPFLESEIGWRVQRAIKTKNGDKAVVLAYVTNRAIQNRLDGLFGLDGWKNEFKEMHKGILCGISIKINDEWITKWDGADLTNIEATKGGLSGSMKRAAVQWGMGRYLYNLTEVWVDVKDKGDNYINSKIQVNNQDYYVKGYWNTPKLPDWALPNTPKKKKQTDNTTEGIHSKTIGEIKKKWLESGQQASTLNAQINKLYETTLIGLTETQGQDFLNKFEQKKGA